MKLLFIISFVWLLLCGQVFANTFAPACFIPPSPEDFKIKCNFAEELPTGFVVDHYVISTVIDNEVMSMNYPDSFFQITFSEPRQFDFSVKAVDANNNETAEVSFSFNLLKTAPEISVNTAVNGSNVDITIYGYDADGGDVVSAQVIKRVASSIVSDNTYTMTNNEVSVSVPLTSGMEIEIILTDDDGNFSSTLLDNFSSSPPQKQLNPSMNISENGNGIVTVDGTSSQFIGYNGPYEYLFTFVHSDSERKEFYGSTPGVQTQLKNGLWTVTLQLKAVDPDTNTTAFSQEIQQNIMISSNAVMPVAVISSINSLGAGLYQVDGSGSTVGPSAVVLYYAVQAIHQSTSYTISNTSYVSPLVNIYLGALGDWTVKLWIHDTLGNTSEVVTQTVTVTTLNSPPYGGLDAYDVPSKDNTYQVVSTGYDNDGYITSYELTATHVATNDSFQIIQSTPFNQEVEFPHAGEWHLELVMYDNEFLASPTYGKTVIATPSEPLPIMALECKTTKPLQLNCNAYGSTGNIASYKFYINGELYQTSDSYFERIFTSATAVTIGVQGVTAGGRNSSNYGYTQTEVWAPKAPVPKMSCQANSYGLATCSSILSEMFGANITTLKWTVDSTIEYFGGEGFRHNFENSGTYTVRLEITNNYGQLGYVEEELVVDKTMDYADNSSIEVAWDGSVIHSANAPIVLTLSDGVIDYASTDRPFSVSIDDNKIDPSEIDLSVSGQISITTTLADGTHEIILEGNDTSEKPVDFAKQFFIGRYNVQVSSSKTGTKYKAILLDYGDLELENETGTFDNLPETNVLFITSLGSEFSYQLKKINLNDSFTLTPMAVGTASTVNNNDFEQGTDGWTVNSETTVVVNSEGDKVLRMIPESNGVAFAKRTYTANSAGNYRIFKQGFTFTHPEDFFFMVIKNKMTGEINYEFGYGKQYIAAPSESFKKEFMVGMYVNTEGDIIEHETYFKVANPPATSSYRFSLFSEAWADVGNPIPSDKIREIKERFYLEEVAFYNLFGKEKFPRGCRVLLDGVTHSCANGVMPRHVPEPLMFFSVGNYYLANYSNNKIEKAYSDSNSSNSGFNKMRARVNGRGIDDNVKFFLRISEIGTPDPMIKSIEGKFDRIISSQGTEHSGVFTIESFEPDWLNNKEQANLELCAIKDRVAVICRDVVDSRVSLSIDENTNKNELNFEKISGGNLKPIRLMKLFRPAGGKHFTGQTNPTDFDPDFGLDKWVSVKDYERVSYVANAPGVAINDISKMNGGYWTEHGGMNGVGSHKLGNNIDFRISPNNPFNYTDTNNREGLQTLRLAKLLTDIIEQPVVIEKLDKVLFDYSSGSSFETHLKSVCLPNGYLATNNVISRDDHKDHFHIQFSDNPKILEVSSPLHFQIEDNINGTIIVRATINGQVKNNVNFYKRKIILQDPTHQNYELIHLGTGAFSIGRTEFMNNFLNGYSPEYKLVAVLSNTGQEACQSIEYNRDELTQVRIGVRNGYIPLGGWSSISPSLSNPMYSDLEGIGIVINSWNIDLLINININGAVIDKESLIPHTTSGEYGYLHEQAIAPETDYPYQINFSNGNTYKGVYRFPNIMASTQIIYGPLPCKAKASLTLNDSTYINGVHIGYQVYFRALWRGVNRIDQPPLEIPFGLDSGGTAVDFKVRFVLLWKGLPDTGEISSYMNLYGVEEHSASLFGCSN